MKKGKDLPQTPQNATAAHQPLLSEHTAMTQQRYNDELYDYLFQLPKVELHAHLNGCIREETLFALAEERGVTLPPTYFYHHPPGNNNNNNNNDMDGLLYNTMPRSLQDCFAMFAEIPAAVNDLTALACITRQALQDFAAHAVVYVELRSTPKRLLRDFRQQGNGNDNINNLATKREYVETILQVMQQFEAEEEARYEREKAELSHKIANEDSSQPSPSPRLPLTCRFLVSVDRSQSEQEAAEHVDLAISLWRQQQQPATALGDDSSFLYHRLLVGMDLGGNPTKQDFRLFRPHFQRARDAGLRLTIHCAEIPCDCKEQQQQQQAQAYEEARAILEFAPDRIGHALLLPPDLMQRLFEQEIPVETCPTSNVMTLELARNHADGTHLTLLQGLAQHGNLRQWLDRKHPITIATDDPGVFGTTLTKEWWLVARTFDLPKEHFDNLASQSLEYAFCDEATKDAIEARLRGEK